MATARQAPADSGCDVRALLPLVFGRRDVACRSAGRFQHLRLYGLVTVTFADFSSRCPCSEQHVHSGLYDGLTWPDTGFASFD
jgi:hypothetical protein